MQNRPVYSLKSVDHALHAAALLQHEGPLRVVDIAELLGVSPSTAHRILTMLVYREFAVQGEDRKYYPGPVLDRVNQVEPVASALRRIARPHLQRLVDACSETANLMVAVDTDTRFILTVECDQVLRVADRAGRSKPLHLTSGGRAILATLDPVELAARYHDAGLDLLRLQGELDQVRANGFAINDQRTEEGLTALGVAIRDRSDQALAAVALAMPTARYRSDLVRGWVRALQACARGIERELNEDRDGR